MEGGGGLCCGGAENCPLIRLEAGRIGVSGHGRAILSGVLPYQSMHDCIS
jgi:hypothetical protein